MEAICRLHCGLKFIYKILGFLTLILLFNGAVLAQNPTFIYSSQIYPEVRTFTTLPALINRVFFGGVHSDPTSPTVVDLPGIGRYDTNERKCISGGYWGVNEKSWAEMCADAWDLRATITNNAYSKDGAASFVNTSVGAIKWFILEGPPDPVNLRVDFHFQGRLYGKTILSGGSRAFFYHLVNFASYPPPSSTTTTMVWPLAIGGAILPPGEPCGDSVNITYPDFCFISDGEGSINHIVRSNPFVVTPGRPFRLGLTLNAAASTTSVEGGETWASSLWPYGARLASSTLFPGITELTSEGFVIDQDGDPNTRDVISLGSLGYTIRSYNPPSISMISPERGGDTGYVTVTINGSGFTNSATVKLTRIGENDITPDMLNIGVGGKNIRARFNLEGKSRGTWDVVVTNIPIYAAQTSVTLREAFTIEERKTPVVWMDIDESPFMLLDIQRTFSILMGNRGNVDAIGTPVIHGIPKGSYWQILDLPTPSEEVVSRDTDEGIAILLPTILVPAGPSPVRLRLRLGLREFVESFKLRLVWEE